MNVNFTDAVMEAWTQTSVKSGYSTVTTSSNASSDGSAKKTNNTRNQSFMNATNGKSHMGKGFPSRQPLRAFNGSKANSRRGQNNNYNNSNANKANLAKGHVDDGRSAVRVPQPDDAGRYGFRSRGNTPGYFTPHKPPPTAQRGWWTNCSPRNAEPVEEVDECSKFTYPQGFQGRPPIKTSMSPTPPKGDNHSQRSSTTPGLPVSIVKSSPTVIETSELSADSPEENTYSGSPVLQNISENRVFQHTRGVQLELSGAGLAMADSPRSAASSTKSKRQANAKAMSRSNTKIPFSTSGSPNQQQARHCDACVLDDMKQWLKKQELAALHEAKTKKAFFEPLQLIKNQYLMHKEATFSDKKCKTSPTDHKKSVCLHTVTLPRQGMIKLTGLPYEFDNPLYYDDRKEQADRNDQQMLWEELYGVTPLPPAPADIHRGPLIRNKSMIRQVKSGEQRLRAELEQQQEKELAELATYSTFVGGLLQFEMPEVPNLNNLLQRFVRVTTPSNDDNLSKNTVVQADDATQNSSSHQAQSKSATLAHSYSSNNLHTPRSSYSEKQTRITSGNPLISPRLAFVTTEPLQNRISASDQNGRHRKFNKESGSWDGDRKQWTDSKSEVILRREPDIDTDSISGNSTETSSIIKIGGKDNGFGIREEKAKVNMALMLPQIAHQ